MWNMQRHHLWAWLIVTIGLAAGSSSCPHSCVCKECYNDLEHSLDGDCKVICESESPAQSLTSVPDDIPRHATLIDLSGNALIRIPKSAFGELPRLEKLDISSNRIKDIEPGAFVGLTNLGILDLSGNGLKFLNASLFEGLPNLKRLVLAGNDLTTIPEGTFDVMPNLVKVDFQSSRLVCDCRLKWVIKWQQNENVRIRDSTVCAEPPEHRGKSLKDLKRKKDFSCDADVELAYFVLSPASSQVVFEGDSLPLECRASVPNMEAHMMWVHGGQQVINNQSQSITIHQTISTDNSIIIQSLVLGKLLEAHSGVWKCFVQTPRGNTSKAVNITVMPKQTAFCVSVTNVTTKGTYSWPKTVSGMKMWLPCEKGPASWYRGDSVAMATYTCSSEGRWESLDVSECAYTSEVTRVLEQYSTFEVGNTSDVMLYMEKLLKKLTNKMDIVYIARIMEATSKRIEDNEMVADFLLETASTLMTLDGALLGQAQAEDKSCTKIIRVLDKLPKELLWEAQSVHKHTRNIVMAAHQVSADSFLGMTCTVYRKRALRDSGYDESSLICNEGRNSSEAIADNNMELEASIYIPSDIFQSVRCLYPLCNQSGSFHLQFITYKNAKLFPIVPGSANRDQEVLTSVISAHIAGVTVDHTTSPIVVTLQLPIGGANHQAVYWDFEANEGRGSWLTTGCSITDKTEGLATINCNHLTHFAVRQDASVVKTPYSGDDSLDVWLIGLFTMHPIMYVGSAILFLGCMAVLITYISGHRFLKMPVKCKHAITNICLCLLLLCVVFTMGIHVSDPLVVCQVVGIAIHYLSLAQLFWIVILAFAMSKKFVKAFNPPPPRDPMEEPQPPRSNVTVYLIGWGIPVIICGISAAIYWKDYSGSEYCFLSLNSAVLTFFVPAGIVILVILSFFLRSCCVLRVPDPPLKAPAVDDNETEEIHVHDDEAGDGATEELITTVASVGTTSETGESHSASTVTPSTFYKCEMTASTMDLGRRPSSQLSGLAALLLLYLLTWACGAIAVALPFDSYINQTYQSLIFSYLYGLSATALGVYVFVFYCISRPDCQEAWGRCCYMPPPKVEIEESLPPVSLQQVNHVRTSARLHSTSSVASTNRSVPMSNYGTGGLLYALQKPIKPVQLQSQSSTHNCSVTGSTEAKAIMFYNPRQNGVARRYWEKKHQREMVEQMQREMNGDSGHSSNTDTRGGMMYSNGKRLSYHGGNSSDANTYKSLDIQIPQRNGLIVSSRPGMDSPQSSELMQNIYNSLSRRNQGPHSPLTIDPVTGTPILCTPIDRRQNGGILMPYNMANMSNMANMYNSLDRSKLQGNHLYPVLYPDSNVKFIPGHSGPSSVASAQSGKINRLSPNNYILPTRSQTPPKPNQMVNGDARLLQYRSNYPYIVGQPVDFPPGQFIDQPVISLSVLRPRESDGDSGQNRQSSDVSKDILKKPIHTLVDLHAVPPSGEVKALDVLTKLKNGGESESDVFSDTDPFLKEIKQRIPQNCKPMLSDKRYSDVNNSNRLSQLSCKSQTPPVEMNGFLSSDGGVFAGNSSHSSQDDGAQRSTGNDSQRSKMSCTLSEPIPEYQKQNNQRTNRSQSLPKGSDHSWEEEFARKQSNKVPYAFVNHQYRDRVLHKLIKQNQESGNSLVDSGVSWLPRSVSAYEQPVMIETDTLVEDSGSSSSGDTDDDDDDIWVLQRNKRKKRLSQETSV